MTHPNSMTELVSATLKGATKIVAPTIGYAALFVLSVAALFAGAEALPDGAGGTVLFLLLVASCVFAFGVFSAAMYREILPKTGGLGQAAWKLSMARILIVVVASIGATMIVLFFSLIGSSLGVVSGESGQDITDMTAQMREGGTFYPLFGLFMLTLFGVFWFAVRMVLFGAATASRGAVHVFRTWAWTKGHFVQLAFGAAAFIILPNLVLGYLGGIAAGLVPASADPAIKTGGAAGIFAAMLLPAWWLGHSFAACALSRLAPEDEPFC